MADPGLVTDRQIVQRRNDERISELQASVEQLRVQHGEIKQQIAVNTALTEQVHANTKDIVETWAALAGGLKVLGWLGVGAKWIAVLVGLVATVLGALHLGGPPAPK